MDAVSALLDGPRAREAFLLRSSLAPPWAIRVADGAPLTLVALLSGTAWIVRDGEARVRLGAGDVAIVRGPEPYLIADDPATAPQAVVLPGQECVAAPGSEPVMRALGLRRWGNAADGPTQMLTGSYHLHHEVSRRLMRALPGVLHLRAEEADCPTYDLLAEEVVRDAPGQDAVLDRLLDLLLILTLRAWFARPEAAAPGWYAAHADPVVGQALRLLQDDPAHPWTVAALARAVGLSRAALARRFTERVGEPPMAFLTARRLELAADLLLEPDATIGSVAAEVGYGSSFALSTAFKRHRGVSPQQHRRAARSAERLSPAQRG